MSSLAATDTISKTQIDSWCNGLTDKSQMMLTERTYDGRGNLDLGEGLQCHDYRWRPATGQYVSVAETA